MSEMNFERIHHIVPAGHIRQYARSTSNSQETELRLAVTQYRPRYDGFYCPRPGDVTILACHANAFPKELYEPMFDALLLRLQDKSHIRIRSIWIADVANQGASGVLNEGLLGNEPSWFDHARDYLALVNHLRKEMPRPIVGFGHSMGATIILNLALLHPRLLTTVIAVEPMTNKSAWGMNFTGIRSITTKRDRWNSRDEAIAYFSNNNVYKNFDPKVTELFKQHGLRNEADGTVTLTTSKDQEVLSFARAAFPPSRDQMPQDFSPSRTDFPDLCLGNDRDSTSPFYRPENTITNQLLPFLRPSCMYVFGNSSHFAASTAEGREDKLSITGKAAGGSGGVQEGRVKHEMLDGSHFVPFENPASVADLTATWMTVELQRWADAEKKENDMWSQVPNDQRAKVSEDWKFWAQQMHLKSTGKSQKARM